MAEINFLGLAAKATPLGSDQVYLWDTAAAQLKRADLSNAALAGILAGAQTGTWTPALIGTTLAGSAAYSARAGLYAKIGPFVAAWWELTLSSIGGATGNVQIDGLPFTSMANSFNFGGAVNNFGGMGIDLSSMQGRAIQASTRIQLLRVIAAGSSAPAALAIANITDTFMCNGVVFYRTE